ncbi:MAG: nitroreductase family protein [Spirochaetales bacterium]|nr:nitroreductase family protein [Spirochaetales bacterium]
MSFFELVQKTRTCRRFDQESLPEGFLASLIDLARVCPSGKNLQPLKYITIDNESFKAELFPHLRWAGALKEWDGPAEGERPTAYVALVLDKNIGSSAGQDVGIVAQTMQLAAMDKGIGSCMIGAFIKPEVTRVLGLDDSQEIQLILALGYPGEERVLVDADDKTGVTYYRDDKGVHYIPKRSSSELLLRHI